MSDLYPFLVIFFSRKVDAVFGFGTKFTNPAWTIVSDEITGCSKAGISAMTRKDNRLVDWWNPAFEKLKSIPKWQDVCQDLTEEHGKTIRSLLACIIVMHIRIY